MEGVDEVEPVLNGILGLAPVQDAIKAFILDNPHADPAEVVTLARDFMENYPL